MTPEAIALKAATVDMIRGVGGVEAAAAFCRVGKSVLSDNGSPNRPDSFVAIDVVAALEPLARERSGWPHVTQALCRQMGGVFVVEPDVPPATGSVLAAMAAASREFNEVTQAVCDGAADGVFCQRDAARLERELDDVIQRAVAMRALARAIKGGER